MAAWPGGAARELMLHYEKRAGLREHSGLTPAGSFSWISPLEFGSRLLQGAQWPHKSLFDLTHDKLFLLAAT